MKKAILTFPMISDEAPQFPTGLYKIASYCKDEYEVIVLDQRIEENFFDKIENILITEEVLCIGVSIMTGIQIKFAMEISKKFKSKVKILFGGIHPTILPIQTLDDKYADFIIIGEGEEAFLNLLRYLDGKNNYKELFFSKEINNLKYNYITQNQFNENLDFVKLGVKDEYFIKRDGMKRAFTLETSRGCPYKCKFCHNTIAEKPYRKMEAENIINIINYLEEKYNIDGIVFQEDNFFVDKKRVEKLVDYFLINNKLKWKANSRISYFKNLIEDNEFMEKIVKSGCNVLQFGIESGSQKILDYINKKINLEDIKVINKKFSKFDIKIRYNFIIGFPSETINDMNKTLEFIKELMNDNKNVEPPFLNIYTPYPGTPLFEEAVKFGFKSPNNFEKWADVNWNSAKYSWHKKSECEFLEKTSKEYYEKNLYLK